MNVPDYSFLLEQECVGEIYRRIMFKCSHTVVILVKHGYLMMMSNH